MVPNNLKELELDEVSENKVQDFIIEWINYLDSDLHLYTTLTAAQRDILGISETEFIELKKMRDEKLDYKIAHQHAAEREFELRKTISRINRQAKYHEDLKYISEIKK